MLGTLFCFLGTACTAAGTDCFLSSLLLLEPGCREPAGVAGPFCSASLLKGDVGLSCKSFKKNHNPLICDVTVEHFNFRAKAQAG